ncbi:hypothetical protein IVB30_37005 [Bradyrhizobium sp. 200]|uniref:hypothetical protein n=1 Tax=Bradyrhizobium sp. 200 TaxID=2782665 RepID=UPI001FFFDBBC|nr:hypothetical protein [Bradyrhizobium sp. 200]UPJ48577.1 hypothetical protein IVB30_37005 [Bradyrhizobium sp. 200]
MKPGYRDFSTTLTRSVLAIAFAVVAQHALVQEVRAQTAAAPDLEAVLAHSKIVKALDDIKTDDERAFAEQKRITGGGGRPKLVVSAHLDTVFPEGTDVTVKAPSPSAP